MRLPILAILCLCTLLAAAQEEQPDTSALRTQVAEFAVAVDSLALAIDSSEEIDSIRSMAVDLEIRSAELIEELEKAHPIDEELLLERDLIDVSQLEMEPEMAVEYQHRAHLAQEAINALMPAYYQALMKINEISARMGTVRKQERAQRLNDELKEIDLMVKEVGE